MLSFGYSEFHKVLSDRRTGRPQIEVTRIPLDEPQHTFPWGKTISTKAALFTASLLLSYRTVVSLPYELFARATVSVQFPVTVLTCVQWDCAENDEAAEVDLLSSVFAVLQEGCYCRRLRLKKSGDVLWRADPATPTNTAILGDGNRQQQQQLQKLRSRKRTARVAHRERRSELGSGMKLNEKEEEGPDKKSRIDPATSPSRNPKMQKEMLAAGRIVTIEAKLGQQPCADGQTRGGVLVSSGCTRNEYTRCTVGVTVKSWTRFTPTEDIRRWNRNGEKINEGDYRIFQRGAGYLGGSGETGA